MRLTPSDDIAASRLTASDSWLRASCPDRHHAAGDATIIASPENVSR